MNELLISLGAFLLSAACFLGMIHFFKELARLEKMINETMFRLDSAEIMRELEKTK